MRACVLISIPVGFLVSFSPWLETSVVALFDHLATVSSDSLLPTRSSVIHWSMNVSLPKGKRRQANL